MVSRRLEGSAWLCAPPCRRSLEHWFEIKRGDYHVFLTPRGDCRGLGVRRQGGAGFEVRELQGGRSNVAFSYRIVGRRKDITAHKRFAKIEVRLPAATARCRWAQASIGYPKLGIA
jgi:hypothetical protein